MGMNDTNSLAHTKWNCKYHIVFAPKYRRKVFYQEKREAVGKILRRLCEWKGVRIVEAEVCPDHIHMLVEIPPKIAVSSFMGYLKGKSSTMLYEQFGELKYKYRNREFWCKGYYVDTVGKNESRIVEMSRNVQSGNTQNLKSTVIQRSFPKWSVAERRKTAAASDQAAVCACAHSRYFTGGSPSGLRV